MGGGRRRRVPMERVGAILGSDVVSYVEADKVERCQDNLAVKDVIDKNPKKQNTEAVTRPELAG